MSTIAAGTTLTTALVETGDTTGNLVIQTNGTTTAVTIGTDQTITLEKSLILKGSTSGTITLSTPAVSGSNTLTLPAATTTLVGLTTTDTLTNKTLTSPTITSPTISGTPVMSASLLTSGTAITLTTQTAPEFTSLPSWIKRIVIMFSGVSTNGTSNLLIRLGTSGGIQTSTYTGRTIGGQITMNSALDWTNGVEIQHGSIVLTTDVLGGSIVFNLLNASTNVWAVSGSVSRSSSPTSSSFQAGVVTLSSTMTTLRLTTANGTDQFDAGTINILYE